MKFAYFPDCSAKSTCSELGLSMMAATKHLGIEFVELKVAACTGGPPIADFRRGAFSNPRRANFGAS